MKALFGQLFPRSRYGSFHDDLDRLRGVVDRVGVLSQGRLIALDDLFKNVGRSHAGKVRTARSRCQRQRQSDDVMGGVADDSLVQIPNLDGYAAVRCSDRSQVAGVAVSTDPDRGSFR